MKQHIFFRVFGAGAILILAGCATAKPALKGQLDANLGAAVRANIQAQFVAPTPKQKADTYIPADPSRAALARKRYRDDNVKVPVPVNASGN
ncbi:MAG: hypothetical protein COA91_02140 [Robiginitomaculum sp.]|nr:MAG: hypothetical protein COA91_02140 [Robiginitomaculum sp.]